MTESAETPLAGVTQLLRRLGAGDRSAEDQLLPQIYSELKRLAAAQMRSERPGHTLQATALVHEAYLRLTNNNQTDWKDRIHFFAVASNVMRRVLVDHARKRGALKRGDPAARSAFDENLRVTDDQCDLIANLDDALQLLAETDPRKAKIVELRFFAGLTEEEIAHALGISSRTVKRDWVTARAWLYGQLGN